MQIATSSSFSSSTGALPPPLHESAKQMTMPHRGDRKQKLVERCLKKMKENRGSVVSQLRSGSLTPAVLRSNISQLINQEWNNSTEGLGPAYEEILHFLETAILEDLRKEEERLVAEYEEVKKFEEEKLRAAQRLYEEWGGGEDGRSGGDGDGRGEEIVLCPVCKENRLLHAPRVILCGSRQCGLRINTKTDDVDLAYLRNRLCELLQQHSACCDGAPVFEQRPVPFANQNMLWLTCPKCACIEIVL
jgi:hypothetical protein